jgi:uncharacterized iron-regulated membrane protein
MGRDVNGAFRKIIFWLHLIAGVVAGVVILVMCVTGAAIAFDKQSIAVAEGDNRRIAPAAPDAARLSVDELLAKARESQSNARPSAITIYSDPTLAPMVAFGRTNAVYINPHTGEIAAQGATGTRTFMRVMTDWHRWLGREGDGRAVGKAITGACNTAFLVLAVSGIYLWWPRRWSVESLKAIVLFRGGLGGKARDWNWHNVIGIWSAPVLIVLTASGMVISYRWASDLVYRTAGVTPPPPAAAPGGAANVTVPTPPPGTKPLGYEQLFAVVKEQAPQWEQITVRFSSGAPRGGGGEGRAPARDSQRAEPTGTNTTTANAEAPRRERDGSRGGGEARGEARGGQPQAVTVSVKERDAWPLFATVTFTLDPHTGEVLKRESYADQDRGRRARSWMRYLHTGEALGWIGQLVAALASLGGGVLVWTGLALSFRRFFGRKSATS